MDSLNTHERLDLIQAARKDRERVPCPRCYPRLGRPTPMKITQRTKTEIFYHCPHCGQDVKLLISRL